MRGCPAGRDMCGNVSWAACDFLPPAGRIPYERARHGGHNGVVCTPGEGSPGGGVRVSRLNLPYLFSKLTLDFLAFSVMVHAAGARRGRGIYHLVEDSKGYRAVYGTCGAPRRGRFLGCVGGVRLRESYPIFQGVTLDFLTNPTTAPATDTRC